jgi:hypothetical protein
VASVRDAVIITADPDQDQAEDDDRQPDGPDQHGKGRSASIGFHLFMRRAHRIRAFAALGHRRPRRRGAKATLAYVLQRSLFGLCATFLGAGAV